MGGFGEVYTDKNHTKISREYCTIKRRLRGQDILRIQKVIDAGTVKKRWLRTNLA